VVKGREEGPLFGWIKIGLGSYGDPDDSTIIHFAVKVHRIHLVLFSDASILPIASPTFCCGGGHDELIRYVSRNSLALG
jgi:hypothetical protein